MRAVTLANPRVRRELSSFVCGWTNIEGRKSYAGTSNKHQPGNAAITVNNCSGHHNVQTFLMTSDGKVVNCLPGFWAAKPYIGEIKLAKKLNSLYRTHKTRIAKRNSEFLDAHLKHAVRNAGSASDAELQGFDQRHVQRKGGDFTRTRGALTGKLKSADQVLHERMAERPFLPLERFDVPSFIDMGIKRYRYNYGIDRTKNSTPRDRSKRKKRR